jgi:hypothetical protein
MSFDIKAFSGDIEFGPNGDVSQVTDSNKLAQDVLKLLNTPIGTNPMNPGYGSTLTAEQIGTSLSIEGFVEQTKGILTDALQTLITQQAYQSAIQTLTDAETIVDFETPIVEQDPQDPRQFNVVVNAISKALAPLSIALVVRY